MRETWNRATPVVELSTQDATALFNKNLYVVESIEPTKGGLANTNLRVQFERLELKLLLRLWTRDPKAAGKEFRLMQMMEGVVPVPKINLFSRNNPVNGYPFMFMEWIDGVRLESILGELYKSDIEHLGQSIGKTLASIHAYRFDQAGFFDEELEVAIPMEMGGAGLLRYTEECLDNPVVSERLGSELAAITRNFVKSENHLLDKWTECPCLTHSDFNCSNILVKKSEFWEVAAVLDWEFAFSGTPFFDFGNLLRNPFGAIPGMTDAVEQGYLDGGGTLPPEWKRMSKLTDLTAWLDFLTRENTGPELISDARAQISRTIAEW
ncbi:MAG: hypothetical protein C0507_18975 [Cyanobacteria bacterium PR.3.49]|nr:hypothetical protein [Cyanobacteria bacterium PR.3.49]